MLEGPKGEVGSEEKSDGNGDVCKGSQMKTGAISTKNERLWRILMGVRERSYSLGRTGKMSDEADGPLGGSCGAHFIPCVSFPNAGGESQ